MTIVVDASVALAWVFDGEQTAEADAVLTTVIARGAVVPSLWRLEVANALQMSVKRGRLDASSRDDCFADLQALDIRIDEETDLHAWSDTLLLAHRWGLTLYDAAYLELALRSQLPLATLDKALRTAAAAQGVQLLGL